MNLRRANERTAVVRSFERWREHDRAGIPHLRFLLRRPPFAFTMTLSLQEYKLRFTLYSRSELPLYKYSPRCHYFRASQLTRTTTPPPLPHLQSALCAPPLRFPSRYFRASQLTRTGSFLRACGTFLCEMEERRGNNNH